MGLSKKDYALIAGVLNEVFHSADRTWDEEKKRWNGLEDAHHKIAVGLCKAFMKENERFNSHKWFGAVFQDEEGKKLSREVWEEAGDFEDYYQL